MQIFLKIEITPKKPKFIRSKEHLINQLAKPTRATKNHFVSNNNKENSPARCYSLIVLLINLQKNENQGKVFRNL